MRNTALNLLLRLEKQYKLSRIKEVPGGAWLTAQLRRTVFVASDNLPSRYVKISLRGQWVCVPYSIASWYLLKGYEPEVSDIISRLLPPGGKAVDVGAHIGYHTILMADVAGPAGRVVAVEPTHYNLQFLRHNIRLNHMHNVTALPYAAGSKNETQRLYRGANSLMNSFYADNTLGEAGGSEDVTVIPLDSLIQGPVDLIKLDIEGAEIDALQGMVALLNHSPNINLIVEWNPPTQISAGHSGTALLDWLEEHGFHLTSIRADGSTHDDVHEFRRAYESGAFPSQWYINLVAHR